MSPVGSYVTVFHAGALWTAKVLEHQDGWYRVEGSADWIPQDEVAPWIEKP